MLAGHEAVIPKDTATVVESIRVLRVARDGAVKTRTAALNQLKDLFKTAPTNSVPGCGGKALRTVAADAARCRPDTTRRTDPAQATKAALRSIGARVVELNAEIAVLEVSGRTLRVPDRPVRPT